MYVNPATAAALDRIAERAADVYAAFTPGAIPQHADVATDRPSSHPIPDPLSAAPPDDAYFVTTDERGRTAYTRDGTFSLRDGVFTGASGSPVLGFTSLTGTLSELRVDPVDASLGRAADLHVEADGTIAYTRHAVDPRNGARIDDRVVIGRLALARFPAATKLNGIAGNRFVSSPGDVPHVGRAGDGNFGTIAPMRSESSRIDIERSLQRLQDAYTAFDALQAAHKAQGGLHKTAMDLLK
jgi:flagellar hook protein FlgE